MGWLPVSVACRVETVRLWSRLVNMEDNHPAKKVFMWSATLARTRHKNWNFMLRELLSSLGMNHFLEFGSINSQFLTATVKEKLSEGEHDLWFQNLWNDVNKPNGNKLRTYRTFKSDLGVEQYMLLNVSKLQRRSLTKLRLGVLPLAIETGRHTRPITPLNERVCRLCNIDTVENELHFLIHCPLYDDQRVLLFNKAQELNNLFSNMNDDDKMIFLMQEVSLQGCLIKTVDQMFARRQIFNTR